MTEQALEGVRVVELAVSNRSPGPCWRTGEPTSSTSSEWRAIPTAAWQRRASAPTGWSQHVAGAGEPGEAWIGLGALPAWKGWPMMHRMLNRPTCSSPNLRKALERLGLDRERH